MEDAGPPGFERGRVVAQPAPATAGLDADQFDRGVVDESRECADGVGSAADAGHDPVWEMAKALQ